MPETAILPTQPITPTPHPTSCMTNVNKDHIQRLFAFHHWATDRVFDALSPVTVSLRSALNTLLVAGI